MDIFIISIRAERLRVSLQHLDHLSQAVTIVPACNGQLIDKNRWHGSLRRGQLGCFESHCRVWRYIVENDVQFAIVLEDDAVLTPSRMQRLQKVTENLPQHWDLLLLGRHYARKENRQRVAPGLVQTGAFWGTHAYLIPCSTAIKLLRHPKVQTMTEPIDEVLSQLGLSDELLILACQPEICLLKETASDTVSID